MVEGKGQVQWQLCVFPGIARKNTRIWHA